MSEKVFPQGFLWGAATSSHQIEGDNRANDWWDWEQRGKATEPSGAACGSYERYEEDFDLARSMGHNAHRFSIEWSRIQPEENRFDEEAVRHYQAVLRALKARGLEPIVTLNHFTIPLWFARAGGWENPKAADYFAAYTRVMVRALGPDVKYWITFNEMNVLVFKGYLEGVPGAWPPGKCSMLSAWRAARNLIQAAFAAYETIHAEYRRQAWPGCRVGVAHHLLYTEPSDPQKSGDRSAARRRMFFNNDFFLRLLYGKADDWLVILAGCSGRGKRALDFIGVNYYFREIIRAKNGGNFIDRLTGEVDREHPFYKSAEKNELKWEIFPEGLRCVVLEASRRYQLPLMITENGICTQDENQRARFIRNHLQVLHSAISEGAEVLGYLYWSLLDNFEWSIGYLPKFGLIAVEPSTLKRAPKSSSAVYAQICQSNRLTDPVI